MYGADEPTARAPRALLAAGVPLRLNGARYDLRTTSGLVPEADAAALLEAHLIGLCPPWSGVGRRFVAAYFEHLRGALAANAERVAARLAPFAGLYAPGDWLFSALAPLPRAHLPVGEGAMVRVDFAFWHGDGFAAALASDSSLPPRRARERDEALARAGIDAMRFGLDEIGPTLFARLLGAHAAFWDDEPIPSGPFAPFPSPGWER